MFQVKESRIQGLFEIQPRVIEDSRGRFVKIYHSSEFEAMGLESVFLEEYYSISHKNVIRGMHFQSPPKSHVKLVYCQGGEALDVVIDLRVGSPTYGSYELFSLSHSRANGLYIPKGLAHGFCALSDDVMMVYKVNSIYSPELDLGISWSSLGIPWPTNNPILSDRDRNFQSFNDFNSPFSYRTYEAR